MSIAFLGKHGYFCGLRSGVISWKNSWGETTSSIRVAVCTLHGDTYVRYQYTATDRSTDEKADYDYKVFRIIQRGCPEDSWKRYRLACRSDVLIGFLTQLDESMVAEPVDYRPQNPTDREARKADHYR